MEGREDYWWTFERGQALLDRISRLERRLEELLSDKGLESVLARGIFRTSLK